MIQFITEEDYNRFKMLDERYYNKRWSYYKEVINLLSDIGMGFNNGLELGCYRFSIMSNGEVMDIKPYIEGAILWDANMIPWDMPDKKYDIFIGLQVLEHLQDQKAIFQEIRRVSKNAVISLPYKWPHLEGKKWNRHYDIDEDLIMEWFGMEPSVSQIVDNRRIINFYRF